MIHETHNPSNYELTIRFVEILIWPVVFLLLILVFKRNFTEAMGRLGSIKADATGVSLTFDNLLDSATETFKKSRPVAVAKSASNIGSEEKTTELPYQQLIDIKKELDKSIFDLAKEEGISVTDRSVSSICTELTNKNIINTENGALMQTLIEVVNAARTDITQQQVDRIKALWHSI